MQQSGKTLSMHNDAIWKGTYTNNGMLLKIHENAFTIGYANVLIPDGTAQGAVKFGNGVFFNLSEKNNTVYVGAPTVTGASPAFGGIMVREPAIASGYPSINDEVDYFQKGLLCRQGYIIYKKGDIYLDTGIKYEDVELFDYAYMNYVMFIRKTDGSVYFSPAETKFENTDDLKVGRVCGVNPDDRSITVYIAPVYLADTKAIAGATPTITAGEATNTEVTVTVKIGTQASLILDFKKTTGGAYTNNTDVLTPTYDEGESKWVLTHKFTGLEKNTDYTFQVRAISASGVKDATATKTTTNT